MSAFTTPLELEFIDGCLWRLIHAFHFQIGAEDGPEGVAVPSGFITDFASIPRGLWNILPPTGRYGKAAVIHDWLYQYRTVTIRPSTPGSPAGSRSVERGEADAVLRDGMRVLGVGRMTRWAIYSGVRVGGWIAWNKYRAIDRMVAAGSQVTKKDSEDLS